MEQNTSHPIIMANLSEQMCKIICQIYMNTY